MRWRKVKNFLPTIILGMFFVAISTTFAAPKDEFVTALTGNFLRSITTMNRGNLPDLM